MLSYLQSFGKYLAFWGVITSIGSGFFALWLWYIHLNVKYFVLNYGGGPLPMVASFVTAIVAPLIVIAAAVMAASEQKTRQ